MKKEDIGLILFFIIFSIVARTHTQSGHESDFLKYILVGMVLIGPFIFDRKKKTKK